MKPTQVAAALRHIAAKIDNSRNPDKTLVARELKRVINIIATDVTEIQIINNDFENAERGLAQVKFNGVPTKTDFDKIKSEFRQRAYMMGYDRRNYEWYSKPIQAENGWWTLGESPNTEVFGPDESDQGAYDCGPYQES